MLQAYSLFLRGCCNAMKDVYNLCDLNTSANMLSIIKKLPYKLRDKWRTAAYDIQEKCGRRAMFADIVNFTEREVKIVMDPVFGDIQRSNNHHDKRKWSNKIYTSFKG